MARISWIDLGDFKSKFFLKSIELFLKNFASAVLDNAIKALAQTTVREVEFLEHYKSWLSFLDKSVSENGSE